MKSIAFPKMFNIGSTLIKKDEEASKECLYLLLSSEKGSLVEDPFFGIRLKKYTFNQNSFILRDIIIDEIYTQIKLFCPQITVERNDISINQDTKGRLTAKIKATNKIDYTTNLYDLVLFNSENL